MNCSAIGLMLLEPWFTWFWAKYWVSDEPLNTWSHLNKLIYLCFDILIYHHIAIFMFWYIGILLYLHIDILMFWHIDILAYIHIDIFMLWYIAIFLYWYIYVLTYWYIGISLYWYIYVLIYWHIKTKKNTPDERCVFRWQIKCQNCMAHKLKVAPLE